MNAIRQHNTESEKGKAIPEPKIPLASSNGDYPYSFSVNDSTVRLRFSNSGDLSTQLAHAFTAMLQ